jgi:flagellum-specific ATP synthase
VSCPPIEPFEGLDLKRSHLVPWPLHGLVERVTGLVIESRGPKGRLGDSCWIARSGGLGELQAEIVGFRRGNALLMPLGDLTGIRPGDLVRLEGTMLEAPAGLMLKGRVLNALGEPIDDLGPLAVIDKTPLHRPSPDPLRRPRIVTPLATGVRSIDGLMTCGMGQRLGIFAGAGVGKSVLLGMIARKSSADVNVIALIGERGREVREFIERDLGPEGLARSVVVVVSSDMAPLLKRRGAYLATALAEGFRDRGMNVLLLMDSLTRVAMAQREIGLAAGEPPTSKGYTPSVFTMMPALLERAGCEGRGSISAFYTVLVEGDDLTDPVADAARSILDGHLVLSRRLADRGHYPAVDVLGSISRVMPDVTGPSQREEAGRVKAWLAALTEAEDLIQIGAYAKGSDPLVDAALLKRAALESFLRQGVDEGSSLIATLDALHSFAGSPSA